MISPTVCETLKNKAVGSHCTGLSLLPGCLCNTFLWLPVPASWGLGALIYTAEMETGFCAKHQVPPVTYLSVTTLHLPLTRGFCMFAWLPPSYHHTRLYETLSLCDTVLHVPCKHPVLSPSPQKISAQTVSGIHMELTWKQCYGGRENRY